jgi:hypothetical protein
MGEEGNEKVGTSCQGPQASKEEVRSGGSGGSGGSKANFLILTILWNSILFFKRIEEW